MEEHRYVQKNRYVQKKPAFKKLYFPDEPAYKPIAAGIIPAKSSA
jgi:hypothetical protein